MHPVFKTQPPLLAVWGKNDPHFLPVGAEAYRRDLPAAEIHFLDTGHFALETHAAEIGRLTLAFLDRHDLARPDSVR
jgi:pimeloyl-ACP methyl ester carboxylesterase